MVGNPFLVIPAKAGIQGLLGRAGTDAGRRMTFDIVTLDSRLRGNDGKGEAGMTVKSNG